MSGCRDCVKGHCDDWNHLVESVRLADGLLSVACQLDEAIQRLDAVPAKMSDEEVPRCACGGLFQPSSAGVMTCDCCGAAWADPTVEAVDPDVGRTLTEVLLAGRRRGNPRWAPSDDDVKVTLHE